jgi:Zn-dependent protease
MFDDFSIAQKLAVWALPVLFAITLREVAAGYMARRCGDMTATQLGRLSPNPLQHIDPIGTLVVPGLLLALGGFLMGWPKRIPVDFSRMRHPKRDLAKVAAAGLGANVIMAVLWAALIKITLVTGSDTPAWVGLRYMGIAGVVINLVLFVLNLLPLPPFDGGRILVSLLPVRQAIALAKIEPYSVFIALGLIFTGILGKLLFWPLVISQGLLFAVFDIEGTSLY